MRSGFARGAGTSAPPSSAIWPALFSLPPLTLPPRGSLPLPTRGERAGVRGNLYAETLLDRRKDGLVDPLWIARCIDQHTAGWVIGGDLLEPSANVVVEIAAEALEPVGGRSCGGAGEADLDRQ